MSLPNHDWVQQLHGTVICRRCGVFNTSMAPLFCSLPEADPTDIKALVDQLAEAQAKIEKLQDMLQRACKSELEWKVAAIGAECELEELRENLNGKKEGNEP